MTDDTCAVTADSVLCFWDIRVDTQAFVVRRGNRILELAPSEYRLLCYLLANPRKAHRREHLLREISAKPQVSLRSVDVAVTRLRRVLTECGEPDPIRTVRGLGYALQPSDAYSSGAVR